MMLLKSFIAKELIDFLERELIAHEPQIQTALLNDFAHEIKKLTDWINKKISEHQHKP